MKGAGLIGGLVRPVVIGIAVPLVANRELWSRGPLQVAAAAPGQLAAAPTAVPPVPAAAPTTLAVSALPTPAAAAVLIAAAAPPAVAASALPAAAAAPPPGPDSAEAAARPRSVVATNGAGGRLRHAPSLQASIVAVLADGTEVVELDAEVVEGNRAWREVRSPHGDVGWMDAELLRPVDPPAPGQPAAAEPAAAGSAPARPAGLADALTVGVGPLRVDLAGR